MKRYREPAGRRAWRNYTRSAKKRGIQFLLTEEEFVEIATQNCQYCNAAPRRMYETFMGVGIDRIDNNVGYVVQNCVPCCTLCNRMKSNLSGREFIAHVDRIATKFYEKTFIERLVPKVYGG